MLVPIFSSFAPRKEFFNNFKHLDNNEDLNLRGSKMYEQFLRNMHRKDIT